MVVQTRSVLTASLCWLTVALTAAALPTEAVPAETTPAEAEATATPETGSAEKLSVEQQRIADKFRHLENVLLRMAELSEATDPHRAALLKKAVKQSGDQLIDTQFDRLAELLGKDRLGEAIDNQQNLDRDLHALLELLLSENRAKRIESEKARIRKYLKRINDLIKRQKDVQGRTQAGNNAKGLSGEQGQLAQKAGELAKDIKHPEQSQPQNPHENPARKRLEAARQRMREAEDKLKQAQQQRAVEKQEEAIRELELAKAELEEILRQLREEEIMRMLAMLEARFREMLQLQREVYDGTVQLDEASGGQLSHNQEIEARRLSVKETQIVLACDKALLVLREDGTAVAFPEAVQQVRDDMQQVVYRLARAKVAKITQAIEEDVIAALEEMLEALKKAQKDQEKAKQPGRPRPPGQPQEPALIDVLAEVKMIRALQMRVNRRTDRYAKLVEDEQARDPELLEALQRLAEREQRIYRAAEDLQMLRSQ